MAEEQVVVSGFGRCGSTLLMRMLDAGGVPIHAANPVSYETPNVLTPEGWLRVDGAAKGLFPYLPPPNLPRPAATIWLDRNLREQTRSHAKMSRLFLRRPLTRAQRRAWTLSLRRDRPKALRQLRSVGRVLQTSFEDLLEFPRNTSTTIAEFLRLDLDVEAMASIVDPRSARCTPDLRREFAHG